MIDVKICRIGNGGAEAEEYNTEYVIVSAYIRGKERCKRNLRETI